MKEFDITINGKLKHRKIYNYMKDNGLDLDILSGEIGITKVTLFKIINLQWMPKENIHSRNTLDKLTNYFNCTEDELFPSESTDFLENNIEIVRLMQAPRTIQKEVDLEYLPFYNFKYISHKETQDDIVLNNERRNFIDEVLKKLKPSEETVIRRRYGNDDYTLQEIGDELGITREAVRQKEARTLRKLRKYKDVLRTIY